LVLTTPLGRANDEKQPGHPPFSFPIPEKVEKTTRV
jgi:hypothetical protein